MRFGHMDPVSLRPRLNISGQCVKQTIKEGEGTYIIWDRKPSELEINLGKLIAMQQKDL